MVFSVFSSVIQCFQQDDIEETTRHLKLLLLASSKRAFLAKKQQRQEVIHWTMTFDGEFLGTSFLGCLKQQLFPPVWPVSILSFNTWRLSIHLGQSKKSFKPSGGTYLEGARGFEKVRLDVAKQF